MDHSIVFFVGLGGGGGGGRGEQITPKIFSTAKLERKKKHAQRANEKKSMEQFPKHSCTALRQKNKIE